MRNTVVISAFPACGKTYNFNRNCKYRILDSDSSNYSWIKDNTGNNTTERNPNFPTNYIEHIKESIGTVDFIFVSSHKVVRDALKENGIKYILIYPDVTLKEEWLQRMKFRGNDSSFLDMMNKNFETFVTECEEEEYPYKYKLSKDSDMHINNDLLTYFKYLKAQNFNVLDALKLIDAVTGTQLIDENKTLLIKVPDKIRSIQNIRFLQNIKKYLKTNKVLILPTSLDISCLPIKTAIQIRDELDKIINTEPIKIKCIKNTIDGNRVRNLTVGKIYEVLINDIIKVDGKHISYINIIADDGMNLGYIPANLFEIVESKED